MKIAVDNQVAFDTVRMLEHKGVQVVLRATDQPDEVWTAQAIELGATVLVSPDSDIRAIAHRTGRGFVRIKQGLKGVAAASYILEQLWALSAKRSA